MEKIYYQTLKETLFHEKLENGLEVYLLPKIGFEKTYGLFSTRFGSIDTTFVPLGQKEMIKVEDGIAHFLEHKMFDMENGDAADEFAKLGASSNAFTSSSRTAYLFSTTTNENDCVELLLDFVQSLNITDESVEKEKGIICQEIKMYDDDPDWRVYFGAIANLYHKHPVKIDIAGTCETVNNTYKDMLELCYQTFYHPHNMMLFVVGNINPEELIGVIKENQNKKHFLSENAIQRLKIEEPTSVAVKEQIDTMQVEIDKRNLTVYKDINDIIYLSNHQHMHQLLSNLITNAIKYNKKDGSITIKAYEVEHNIVIEVSDTGRGISKIDQGRVFERFFRCDEGRDKETGGTGLGLAIVKHIVHYYQGNIVLTSKLDEGTTFKIILPKEE